jgi:hypothetical protein
MTNCGSVAGGREQGRLSYVLCTPCASVLWSFGVTFHWLNNVTHVKNFILNFFAFFGKCGIKHEGLTGKRRYQRAQMVELEPVEVVVPELEVDASECVDNDARMTNMLTIMSRFASRMDQQQEQLSSIQAALMSPTPELGAIPKRRDADAVPQSLCAQNSSIPSLQGLRADAAAALRRPAWWRHLTSEGQVICVMLVSVPKQPRGDGLAPGARTL